MEISKMNDNRWLDKDKKFYNYRTSDVSGSDIFDMNVASNSWAGNFLDDPEYMLREENMVMHIEYLTPREYWERCARDVFNKPVSSLLHQWRTLDEKTLDHLKQVITIYHKKFPITYIDYAHHNGAKQEGLHRMIVAGDLFGWDTKFPVMIIEWADKKRAAQDKINIRKNKINNYLYRAVNKSLRYNYYNLDELKDQLYDDISDELKYDEEFENKSFDLLLQRNDSDDGYIVIVNNNYSADIYDKDINFIKNFESNNQLNDLDLDDSLIDLLDEDYINVTTDRVFNYLTSRELITELSDEFGNDFSKKPLCREICEFIEERCPSCEILKFSIGVWKLGNYELEPISMKGHCVIRYHDYIFDYTSNQYVDYGIDYEEKIPRILKYNPDLSSSFDTKIYSDKDYVISI